MNTIEPTEMIYSVIRLFYPLASGEIDGYQYAIINYGHHPCAYVNIPDKHPLRGNRTMIERSIKCHGGITFMENFRGANARIKNQRLYELFGDTFVIGWDYTHYGDFLPGLSLSINGKMWSSEEIYNEVVNVIHQLEAIRLEAENNKIKAEIEETKAETERLKQEYKSLQKEKDNESME